MRMHVLTGENRYLDLAAGGTISIAQKYAIGCELLMGLAGHGTQAQILGDDSYRSLAWRTAGTSLFEVHRDNGIAFPAARGAKVSCTLVDGSAGVTMFLDRLQNDKPNKAVWMDDLLRSLNQPPH